MTKTRETGPFRVSPWLTICTLPVLAALLGLGTWQLQRLEWKRALIAERAAARAAPALSLGALPGDWRSALFRRVRAEGRFRHDLEIHTVPIAHRGRPGIRVMTPLVLTNGGAVLVDRGWVPLDRQDRATRRAGNPRGTVTVSGALRAGGKGSGWTPDNEPAKRVWHYVDPPAMAAAMGVADAKLYYIAVDETPNPGGYPIGGATGGTLPNNHLQYAITWYALAVALVVIYIVFHLKRRV